MRPLAYELFRKGSGSKECPNGHGLHSITDEPYTPASDGPIVYTCLRCGKFFLESKVDQYGNVKPIPNDTFRWDFHFYEITREEAALAAVVRDATMLEKALLKD